MALKTFAIVGASLAGAHAAHQLRKEGFDGRILLIGAETHLPYDRPPLSKGVLLGTVEPAATALWSQADHAQADIEVMLATRVTRIRPTQRALELDDDSDIMVDRILLCTGAHPRTLAVPGLELSGVHPLRTLEDAVLIRDALQPGARVVVIGFGFIGAEVAAAAAIRGCRVTLLEAAALPMQRVLGATVGQRYCDLHKEHGVEVRLSSGVTEIRGKDHCRAVVLTDGNETPADVVVYGVGVTPSTELAEAAGINVANGIVVDAHCRTSIDGVFACGDVAARPSSFATANIRIESWQNAYKQGVAAAKSMLGSNEPFDDLPWFWTDQYDVKMQMAGLPSPTDETIWRPAPNGRDGVALYVSEGLCRAVVGFNRPREVRAGTELIRRRVPINRAALADASVDLGVFAANA